MLSTAPPPYRLLMLASIAIFASPLASKSDLSLAQFDTTALGDPFYFLFLLIGIALVPFLAVVATSFTKIVVVLSITRQAVGTAQTPPSLVIMSLAMMLTGFSMYPVMVEIYNTIDQKTLQSKTNGSAIISVANAAKEPMRAYMTKHARAEDRELFLNLMRRSDQANVSENDFIILAPAFLISELTLAFQIGFLIYLPFLVIDMTVANLLMALGMQMLSPTTISLPFKILLFVLVDGWRLLAEGLAKV